MLPATLRPTPLVCLALLGSSACSYDLAALQRAVEAHDLDGGAAVPKDLIDLFEDTPGVGEECQRCVRDNCAAANDACHDDPECEQVTACLARSADPRNHAECREQHRAWFLEHIAEIEVGGPFFDCAFWRECRSQCEADAHLQCLDDYRWPRVQSGTELELTLLLEEALLSTPGAGARVKVCRLEDIDCDAPSMTARADDDGLVELRLPAALGQFTGYVEITGGGLAPTLLVFGWPVASDDALRMPIVSETTLTLQQNVGGRTAIPGTGMVQARVRGCSRVGTRDVRIGVEPPAADTETWYFDDQAPTFDAEATFSNGNAGVLNVREGLIDVVGTHVEDDREVMRWKVPVRADHLTIVLTAPRDG